MVGVVAPAAAIDPQHLERGVAQLIACGYRVKVSDHALACDGILAGSDELRARDLQRFFDDPEVTAIVAARGGYGSGRLLPLLDFERLARRPKIVLAYSDGTFLLNALVARAGMIGFHGPMVESFARGIAPAALAHMKALLCAEAEQIVLSGSRTIHRGRAEGELVGGCLSVLVAMLGTPYCPDFKGKLLFLEDTGEKAYRIDRMLVQLRQSGVLRQVAGIVFGGLRPVGNSDAEGELINRFIAEQTADLEVPVLGGVEAGHGTLNLVLPLGIRACIDAGRKTLTLTEAATISRREAGGLASG